MPQAGRGTNCSLRHFLRARSVRVTRVMCASASVGRCVGVWENVGGAFRSCVNGEGGTDQGFGPRGGVNPPRFGVLGGLGSVPNWQKSVLPSIPGVGSAGAKTVEIGSFGLRR